MLKRTACLAVGATSALIAGCNVAAPLAQPTTTTQSIVAPERATRVVTGDGGMVVMIGANGVKGSSDAGRSWEAFGPAGEPVPGRSLAARGSELAVVTVQGGALILNRSSDHGATWSSQPILHDVAGPDVSDIAVSLSQDGQSTAITVGLAGAAGVFRPGWIIVAQKQATSSARSMPAAGTVSWQGNRLVLVEAAAAGRLYTSDDLGATWVQRPVLSAIAAGQDVAPDAPSPGVAVPRPDGAAVVPVVTHSGKATLVAAVLDARGSMTTVGSVDLVGDVGAGVRALATSAGDRVVILDPTSPRLLVVTGDAVTIVPAAGLPAAPTSVTFADAQFGYAETTVVSCQAKDQCTNQTQHFRTSDGGGSWTPA